jgi:protein-tyrosine phosphatase
MKSAAAREGISIHHKGRQVSKEDLDRFDLVLAMDSQNYEDLVGMAQESQKGKIRLFREFDPEGPGDVPDPYFGGDTGFALVMRMLIRTCSALLDQVEDGRWEQ